MSIANTQNCEKIFPNDAALHAGIKEGNPQAVHCLYRSLYKKSFQTVVKLVFDNKGNRQDAEDLFQEAFITFRRKILDGSYTYQEGTAMSTYFYEIYRLKWMDEMKRITRTRMVHWRLDYEKSKETEPAELQLIRTEKQEKLRSQVEKLGEQCAFILKKFVWEKWSLESIADSLKMTTESAKNQKYRCMQKLRKMYVG